MLSTQKKNYTSDLFDNTTRNTILSLKVLLQNDMFVYHDVKTKIKKRKIIHDDTIFFY